MKRTHFGWLQADLSTTSGARLEFAVVAGMACTVSKLGFVADLAHRPDFGVACEQQKSTIKGTCQQSCRPTSHSRVRSRGPDRERRRGCAQSSEQESLVKQYNNRYDWLTHFTHNLSASINSRRALPQPTSQAVLQPLTPPPLYASTKRARTIY